VARIQKTRCRVGVGVDEHAYTVVHTDSDVLTLNRETDEFEEGKGKGHQACTCAYMPVRRSSHAGPGSRWGGYLGTRGAFVIR